MTKNGDPGVAPLGAPAVTTLTAAQVEQVMNALESDADLDARRAAFEMLQEACEPVPALPRDRAVLRPQIEQLALDIRREAALWPHGERAQQVARLLTSLADRIDGMLAVGDPGA